MDTFRHFYHFNHPSTLKEVSVLCFLFLLRYDISELWEMGGGVEMRAVEVVERNWSVLLHRVKTWPQLMCCALV